MVVMRALSGQVLCSFPLLKSDTRTSVGALYQHAKSSLQLQECDFSLTVGTSKLDSLTARLFMLKAVKDELKRETPNTLAVTLIRSLPST